MTQHWKGLSDTPLMFRIIFPVLCAVLAGLGGVFVALAPSWPLEAIGGAVIALALWFGVFQWREMNEWDRKARKNRQQWAEYMAVCDAAPKNFTARMQALNAIEQVTL